MYGDEDRERILLTVVDVIDEGELRAGSPPAYVLAITSDRLVLFGRGASGFAGVMRSILSGKWEMRAGAALSEQDLTPLYEGDPEPRVYERDGIVSIDLDRGRRFASGLEVRTGEGGRDLFSFPRRSYHEVLRVLEDEYRGLVHRTSGLLDRNDRR